jgi:hypothetical protein
MVEKAREATGVVRHVAKMVKRDAVTSGIPIYSVTQSFFDPDNSLSAAVGYFIQTNAVNWIKRMGSIFKKVRSVPEGHAEAHGVFVISDTVEDPEKPQKPARRNFKEASGLA